MSDKRGPGLQSYEVKGLRHQQTEGLVSVDGAGVGLGAQQTQDQGGHGERPQRQAEPHPRRDTFCCRHFSHILNSTTKH